jgi:hypothetical protein
MNCIHCEQEINPLRLKALPSTRTCVNCSTTGAKRSIIVTLGEKDHTCNEVIFLEDDQYEKYVSSKDTLKFDESDLPTEPQEEEIIIEEDDEENIPDIDSEDLPEIEK